MSKLMWLAVVVGALSIAGCGDPEEGGNRNETPDGGGTGGTGGGGGPDSGPPVATCSTTSCAINATCSEASGSPVCACAAGYSGDGTTSCADVDECADGTDDCSDDATCANDEGSFGCSCKVGYTGDGKTCEDFDECKSAQNTCDPNAECANETGSFGCACNAGTEGDGFGCGDVDECDDADDFECDADASCVNTFGDYTCDCDALFTGDGKTCEGLCEAALDDTDLCDPNGICRVVDEKLGKALCDACAPGFVAGGTVGDGTKQTCAAAGDCPAACDGTGGDDADNAICTGGAGTRVCECAPGFSGDPATDSCADDDECATSNGGCGSKANCVNAPGGFVCDCKEGYTKDPSGNCVNLNECAEDPGPCHPNATCTDDDPGFDCKCKPGYEGDGAVCRDVNECKEGTDDCPSGATCINTAGSFECTDIDECAMSLDDCDKNASCENKDPGYACECDSGYLGSGKDCACDLSGYWAMRQDVTVTWPQQVAPGTSTVTISCGCMKTTVWEIHKYEYDGKKIKVWKKGCGQERAPDLVSPFFLTAQVPAAETYSSYVPMSVFDPIPLQKGVDLPVVGALPGTEFTSPTEAAVVGIKLDDPLNDPWPASRADVNPVGGVSPAWDDIEDDGQPGLTLWPQRTKDKTIAALEMGTDQDYSYLPVAFILVGPDIIIDQRAGCLSGATRVKTHLEAEVKACDRITGNVVNEGAESRFHSCKRVENVMNNWNTLQVSCEDSDWTSGVDCAPGDINFLDMQDQSAASGAAFELVKIADLSDDEPSCATVRDELPALGVRVCSNACDDD
jgi:hypothetical protein